MVPATIYGTGKDALSIVIEEKEITKYYRKPQYMSQVFQLEIGSKKHKVLPKDIQLNPITDVVSHADFTFLGNKMQEMKVPVVYLNNETRYFPSFYFQFSFQYYHRTNFWII